MASSKKVLKKYTVVSVYPDEGQTITECLKAKDVEDAIKEFWNMRGAEDTGVSIVEIFEGHCKSVMEVCWVDHPLRDDD